MALAFPGQFGSLWDAVIESQNDPSMRFRVLQRDPSTIQEALKIATRLEALGTGDVENRDNLKRCRDKFIKNNRMANNNNVESLAVVVRELRKELKQNKEEIKHMLQGTERKDWQAAELATGPAVRHL